MAAAAPNFISEIFFLTTAFFHIGLRRVMTNHEHKLRGLQRMKEELQKAENDNRHAGVRPPAFSHVCNQDPR
jgi:hypothetical protein